MVWYGMVWYGMVFFILFFSAACNAYGMVWYGMVWYFSFYFSRPPAMQTIDSSSSEAVVSFRP